MGFVSTAMHFTEALARLAKCSSFFFPFPKQMRQICLTMQPPSNKKGKKKFVRGKAISPPSQRAGVTVERTLAGASIIPRVPPSTKLSRRVRLVFLFSSSVFAQPRKAKQQQNSHPTPSFSFRLTRHLSVCYVMT